MKNKLKVTTPNDLEIAMTRVFDAPRTMVYEAYTKPELLKQWLGVQNGWTFAECEMDLRVGGKYRWIWRHAEHGDMKMGGIYHEIVAPERIVATEKFDDPWYDGEALGTSTFVEVAGKTTLTMTVRYDTKEIRDSVLASPMEGGVARSFDKLDELLAG